MDSKVRDRLRFLFQVASGNRPGVIQFRNGKPPRNFHLDGGMVQIVSGTEPVPYFAKLLTGGGLVRPRKLTRALKILEERGGFLFEVVVELGGVKREALREYVRYMGERELGGLLDEPSGGLRFRSEALDAESFGEGVEEWYLGIPFLDWVIDSARSRGVIEIFDEVFPSPHDVPVRREGAESASIPQRDTERGIFDVLDGVRDIGEIVAASGADRFDVLATLYRAERSGEIRRRGAEELFDLGLRFQREGRLDKCQKLLLRARESGRVDERIFWELARSFELMDDKERAVNEYVEYSRRAEDSGRLDDALRGVRRAMELDPANIGIRDALIRILAVAGSEEERIRETAALVPTLLARGMHELAEERIRELLTSGRADAEVCRMLETCWSQSDRPIAEAACRMADDLVRDGFPSGARRLLEYRLSCDPEDLDARLRHALLLADAGEEAAAVAEVEAMRDRLAAVASFQSGDRVERARAAFELVVCADAAGPEAHRWLAAYHEARGGSRETADHLEALSEIVERGDDAASLVSILERLVALAPDRPRHRRRLGEAYLRDGRDRKGNELLLEVAREAFEGGRRDEGTEVLHGLIERTPWELRAYDALLGADRAAGDTGDTDADEIRRTAGLLALALGRFAEARGFLEPLRARHPEDAELLAALNRVYEKLDARDPLLTGLRDLAVLCRERGDFGMMERARRRGLEIDPEDEVLRALERPASHPIDPKATESAEGADVGPEPAETAVVLPGRGSSARDVALQPRILDLLKKRAADLTPAKSTAPAKPTASAPTAEPRASASPEKGKEKEKEKEKEAPEPLIGKGWRAEKPSISGIVDKLRSIKGN